MFFRLGELAIKTMFDITSEFPGKPGNIKRFCYPIEIPVDACMHILVMNYMNLFFPWMKVNIIVVFLKQ